jgi:hypothetical protein
MACSVNGMTRAIAGAESPFDNCSNRGSAVGDSNSLDSAFEEVLQCLLVGGCYVNPWQGSAHVIQYLLKHFMRELF